MDIQRFEELMKNRKFAEKIVKMQTPEEVQEAFKKEGAEISLEEAKVLSKVMSETAKKGRQLSEDELKNIAGCGEFDGIGYFLILATIVLAPVLIPGELAEYGSENLKRIFKRKTVKTPKK